MGWQIYTCRRLYNSTSVKPSGEGVNVCRLERVAEARASSWLWLGLWPFPSLGLMHFIRRAVARSAAHTTTRRSYSRTATLMAPSAPHIATSTPAWKDWRLDPPSATPLDSTTFRNQAALPRLPVPPLEGTLKKVVESCRPLAKDADEFKALERKVQQFSEQGGLGQELQKRLEAKREEQ